MLIVYTKIGCPYSGKVLRALEALDVAFEERSTKDEGVREELIARGGKKQVPFLFSEEDGIAMYESDAIIEYLCERFGGDPSQFSGEVAHVCPID